MMLQITNDIQSYKETAQLRDFEVANKILHNIDRT